MAACTMSTLHRIGIAAPLTLWACGGAGTSDEPAKLAPGDRQRGDDTGAGVSAVDGASGLTLTPGANDAQSWVELPASTTLLATATRLPDGSLTGSLRYQSQRGEDTICDIEVGLGGSPWAGDCEGCDFVFDVDATLVADRSGGGCPAPTLYTLLDNPTYGTHDALIGFWSSITTPVYTWDDGYGGTSSWGGYTYSDVFQIGYSVTWPAYTSPYGGYYPGGTYGPMWSRWSIGDVSAGVGGWDPDAYSYGYDSPFDAAVSADGVTWGMSSSYMAYAPAFGEIACEGYTWAEAPAVALVTGDTSVQGELPCVSYAAGAVDTGAAGAEDDTPSYFLNGAYDAHTFVGAAGDEVQVAVDTIDAARTFDPVAYVLGPTDCVLAFQDSGADCTAPPTWGQCPSFKVELPEDGEYTVIVTGWSTCEGPTAAYQLDVVRR